MSGATVAWPINETMRRLLFLLVFAFGVAVPALALADGGPTLATPTPATVAACQAEAAQLGKDAFVAKYGPTEPFGHCYAAHATATPPTTTTTTTQDSPAATACKAEYLKLGAAAFAAKYGPDEPYGHCLHGQSRPATTTTTEPTKPVLKVLNPSAAVKAAQAGCLAEGKKAGKDAFAAKYGAKEPFGQCVKAALAKHRR